MRKGVRRLGIGDQIVNASSGRRRGLAHQLTVVVQAAARLERGPRLAGRGHETDRTVDGLDEVADGAAVAAAELALDHQRRVAQVRLHQVGHDAARLEHAAVLEPHRFLGSTEAATLSRVNYFETSQFLFSSWKEST